MFRGRENFGGAARGRRGMGINFAGGFRPVVGKVGDGKKEGRQESKAKIQKHWGGGSEKKLWVKVVQKKGCREGMGNDPSGGNGRFKKKKKKKGGCQWET